MLVACGWEIIEEMILSIAEQSQRLSYMRTWKNFQVSLTGFESTTSAMLVQCSYHLSYESTQMSAA